MTEKRPRNPKKETDESPPPKEVHSMVLPRFMQYLNSTTTRTNLLYGGAGSGKSYAIAQFFCKRLLTIPGLKMLITRKFSTTMRTSVYGLCKEIMESWQAPYLELKSAMVLADINRQSAIYFKGLDKPEKFRSSDFNCAWMEEVFECTSDDYMHVDLCCRRAGRIPNQIFLSCNPVDARGWVITEIVNKAGVDPDISVMHSTYKDNPILPDAFIKMLEGLAERDENFYRIYTLGLPGILKNVIYHNYDTISFNDMPEYVKSNAPHSFGLDWGFNNPLAFVAVWEVDGEYYIHELLYQSGMTNRDFIDWLETMEISRSVPIRCDPSRPENIEELCRSGYNAVKANNRVIEGLDFLKGHFLHVSGESENILKEIQRYSYIETRDKEVLEEPVKAFDHAMDSMRYAIFQGGDVRPFKMTMPDKSSFIPKSLPSMYDSDQIPSMVKRR